MRRAAPYPMFFSCFTTVAPSALAISAVMSWEPSSHTITLFTCFLVFRTIFAMVFSSSYAGMHAIILGLRFSN